jgi:hypothetical protein
MRALVRVAIRVLAVIYLFGIFFDGVGFDPPLRGLPGPIRFAFEVAALFPDAATAVSEYRAEGWLCRSSRWEEIDTRKYFPLHPDDKENRFQRSLHFYHDELQVRRALDNYLTDSHNNPDTNDPNDGIPAEERVGGVRLDIVRWPVPAPGDKLIRYSILPLNHLRPDATVTIFYEPPADELKGRCNGRRGDTGR